MANNVAYTSGELSLHTDYPALHHPPGVSEHTHTHTHNTTQHNTTTQQHSLSHTHTHTHTVLFYSLR